MLEGYRTYLVSALIAIFGVLAATDWNSVIDNPQAGFVAIGAAIIMAIMRSITKTPPGPLLPK